MIVINKEKCIGCEVCLNNCPCNAITYEEGVCKIDADVCAECGNCKDVCPVDAPEKKES